MTRLRRILLNAATSVSLVLCVVMTALWARSYRAADHLFNVRTSDERYYGTDFVVIWQGRFILQSGRLDAPIAAGGGSGSSHFGHRVVTAADLAELLPLRETKTMAGFGWDRYRYEAEPGFPASTGTMQVVVVPLYALTLALAVMPFLKLRKCLRWRRADAAPGICPTCGYDLRATPDKCPECGQVPSTR